MPKNGKPNYPPIRSVPPTTPRPTMPEGAEFSGEVVVDFFPTEPLLLNLTHLNPAILATLEQGDQVILLIDSIPIYVTTLLGVPIGQVGLDDQVAVSSRRTRSGVVVSIHINRLDCIVEVR